MNIKENLKFTLFFNDEIEYLGEKLSVPSQDVALIEVIYVGQLSKGKIIEKYDTFNDHKRVENLEKGQLEGVNAFLKINLDDGFQNTSPEELNSLCEIINDIRIGAAK